MEELPFTKADEMPTLRCLPVLNLTWLCVLSIALLILWSTSVENGTFHPPQSQKSSSLQGYPFNVVLPRVSVQRGSAFTMRVPATGYLPIEDIAQIGSYHVCCRSIDRLSYGCNTGVVATLQQERMSRKVYAAARVDSTELVGSTCILYFNR